MTVLSSVLMYAGTLVVLTSVIGALRTTDVFVQLHFLAPVTSLGAPLIGAGIAVANGISLTSATVLLGVLLQAVTGPVIESATARLHGRRAGVLSRRSPP